MHELPKELGNSLRSFRNSIHRNSGQYDLESLDPPRRIEELEKAAHQTSSSLILHPAFSRQALCLNAAAQDVRTQQPKQQEPGQQAQPPPSRCSSRHSHHKFTPLEASAAGKRPLLTAPKIADPDPAADRLDDDQSPLSEEDFFKLMGMKPPASKLENPKNIAMSNGLYARILAKYKYVNTKYRIFDVLTYVLLVLQLFLGAVFIVLGSLTSVDAHVSIAVLGALSTVTAGSLAPMKGQGLPNRLHQMRDDLHNVKFEAEELYWDVAAGRPVLYRDIRKLREDYLRVMEDGGGIILTHGMRLRSRWRLV